MLFFLLKPVFGTALLRLHRFQAFAGGFDTTPNFGLYTIFKKECLPPGFSAGCRIIPFNVRRKVEIESNVELIPTINIYPADKLVDNHLLCFKTGTVVQVSIGNQLIIQVPVVMRFFSSFSISSNCAIYALCCLRIFVVSTFT